MLLSLARNVRAVLFTVFWVMAFSLFAQFSPAPGTAEPRRFAILVGINQYADAGLVSLQKAQNDAEDLGRALSRLGGYRAVIVMSGGLPYTDVNFPSRNKILDRVASLAKIVRPDDQVLFFFSGHGVNDKSGASVLLPIDAQVRDPVGTGIDVQRDISAPLEAAGVKNILFLIDACQKIVAKDKGLAVVGINEVRAGGRAVVITATGKGEASYEDPQGANGLFTAGILAGLSGEADLNRDGSVSVVELERYLPDAVSERAFGAGLTQKPAVFDSGAGTLQPPLAKLASLAAPASTAAAGGAPAAVAGGAPASAASVAPTAKAQFVSFKLPEDLRADLRLLSPEGRELRVWSDTASFSEKLEPGTYRVEAQDRSYLYYPFSTSFSVGGSKVTVSLDLKPNFGSLAVSCDPPDGVDVILNGEKRGTLSGSGLVIDRLKSGSYELVLSRELYDTKRQSVQIEDGKTATLKLALSPNFFTLSVSEKSGAAAGLFVDGQNRGGLPLSLKLPFRDAELRVVPTDPRYKEWTATVHPVAKGSTETRVAALVGRTGTLELTTTPDADAEVTLAPAGGGAAQKIGSAPLDYETLIGDYSVVAQATVGGKKLVASATVSLREGQTSSLRLELKEAVPAVPEGFVYVPGGTFVMGSPESEADRQKDEVQHQVNLTAFGIAKTDVTMGEFRAFVNATGYKTSAEIDGGSYVWDGKAWVKKADINWRTPGFTQDEQHPVVHVSWYDAVAYCNWKSQSEGKGPAYRYKGEADFKKWPAGWNTKTHNDIACDFSASGYRLPTEAEWEYAAKGGPAATSLAVNAVYAGSANLEDVAWYYKNSGGATHPVGQKAPNALGLYDMAGNVWQWCWDWYGNYPAATQASPRGPDSGDIRVLRGGSWDCVAALLRSARRGVNDPWNRDSNFGFRLLCPQTAQGGVSAQSTVTSVSLAAPAAPAQPTLPSGSAVPAGFVLVPGSTFTMGSPANEEGRGKDEVQHRLSLSAFAIGKYEVTQSEWVAVMGSNPSYFKGDRLPVENVSWYDILVYCNRRSMKEGLAPCYSISGSTDPGRWGAVPTGNDATWNRAACNFAANGYRLPTEAEWEYAARGGQSGVARPVKYAGADSPDQVAWYSGNSGSTTHPVGLKAPNALGLYDMSGNVWEWCWDWYGSYSSGTQSDPRGPDSGDYRVLRGGSWSYVAANPRSAVRLRFDPWDRNSGFGFRLLCPQIK